MEIQNNFNFICYNHEWLCLLWTVSWPDSHGEHLVAQAVCDQLNMLKKNMQVRAMRGITLIGQ
jgi:hypothetical protein